MKSLYPEQSQSEQAAKGLQVKILTAPAKLVVGLAESKTFLRVEHAEDDGLIESLIKAVTEKAEEYTHRAFIKQKVMAYWSVFTSYARLPKAPHIALADYLEGDDDFKVERLVSDLWTEVEEGDYTLEGLNEYTLRVPSVFSTTSYSQEPLRVTYYAGYGAEPSAVPEGIKHALKDTIAFLYENRGELQARDGAKIEAMLTKTTQNLLTTYQVY